MGNQAYSILQMNREDGEIEDGDDYRGDGSSYYAGIDEEYDEMQAARNYQDYKRRRVEREQQQLSQQSDPQQMNNVVSSINSMATMMQNFMQAQQQQQAYMYNAMQNWQQPSMYQGYSSGGGQTGSTGYQSAPGVSTQRDSTVAIQKCNRTEIY